MRGGGEGGQGKGSHGPAHTQQARQPLLALRPGEVALGKKPGSCLGPRQEFRPDWGWEVHHALPSQLPSAHTLLNTHPAHMSSVVPENPCRVLPSVVVLLRGGLSFPPPTHWDPRQLCSGHSRNKCKYPESTRSPLETGAHQNDNEQPRNCLPVVAESPTPWAKPEEGE